MNDEVTITQADPTQGPDKDFLENAVRAIVDNPDAVVVTRAIDDLGVLLTLQVAQADMSKLIGKAGRTVKSLRSLLHVVGAKHDLRSNLKVLEADGSEYRAPERADRPERAPRRDHTPAAAKPAPVPAEPGTEGADALSAFDS